MEFTKEEKAQLEINGFTFKDGSPEIMLNSKVSSQILGEEDLDSVNITKQKDGYSVFILRWIYSDEANYDHESKTATLDEAIERVLDLLKWKIDEMVYWERNRKRDPGLVTFVSTLAGFPDYVKVSTGDDKKFLAKIPSALAGRAESKNLSDYILVKDVTKCWFREELLWSLKECIRGSNNYVSILCRAFGMDDDAIKDLDLDDTFVKLTTSALHTHKAELILPKTGSFGSVDFEDHPELEFCFNQIFGVVRWDEVYKEQADSQT